MRIEDFWKFVDKENGPIHPVHGKCWTWRRCILRNGYGLFGLKGAPAKLSHRAAWELTNGPIPDGLFVLHKCDNRPCCNPAHLFLGTAGQNHQDAKSKNRHSHGSGHGNAKLTEESVRLIDRLREEGLSLQRIARRLGVDKSAIRQASQRKTWAHVPREAVV